MMKPIRFNYDMDGVLVDLNQGLRDQFNTEYPDHQIEQETFDIWRAGVFDKIAASGINFWKDLPILPGAHSILAAGKKYSLHRRVITAYPRGWATQEQRSPVYLGKKFWLLDQVDFETAQNMYMCYAHQKQEFCDYKNFVDVLIDDHISNISRWVAAGGVGILYQSPEQVIDEINEIGAKYRC